MMPITSPISMYCFIWYTHISQGVQAAGKGLMRCFCWNNSRQARIAQPYEVCAIPRYPLHGNSDDDRKH